MKILLATDGSDCARQAIDFLRRFPIPDNSSVILLTVLVKEFFKGRDKSDLSPEQRDLLHQTKQEMRDEGKYLLEEEAKEVRGARLKVETLVRSGHPAEEIVLAAKELSSDLVVVGSHGLTGIKRFLLGSVSNHVLEYAPCSVLIVKERREEDGVAKNQELRVLMSYANSASVRHAQDFMVDLGSESLLRELCGEADFVVAVGTAPDGIDFDSYDGQPVKIVVLIAGPGQDQQRYLQILARVTLGLKSETEPGGRGEGEGEEEVSR